MATHGSVVQFDPAKEEWTSYVERLNYYLIANDVSEDTKKCAILMSGCGPTVYKIIRSLVDADTRKTIKYDELLTLLADHFDLSLHPLYRFKFYNRIRAKGETIAAYVAALRALAEHCEFGEYLKMMLRDRLVCGVNHEGIQCRLLTEKNLSYDKALEIALSTEAAAKGSKDINAASTTPIDQSLNYTSGKKYSSEKTTHQRNKQDRDSTAPAKLTVTCCQCGGQGHSVPECKFRTAECRRCHKTGHIARVCRSKGQSNPKKTHYVQEATELSTTEDPSYDLFNLQDNTYEPITVELELNQVPLTMELDTGASLTLINKASYDLISQENQCAKLEKPDVELRTYTGEAVKILGSTTVEAKYGEQNLQLIVHVVDGQGPNLLGRDWLSKFKINELSNIHTLVTPSKLDQVLNKHTLIFEEGLGTLKDVKVKLLVDPSVSPKFYKARTIPFALKERVETELQKLEASGIISPVDQSDWAAPIVPVMKQNGHVRICGNYRVTVNQAIKVDSYSLPRVEDLFSALAGGKYFTKLDMSQAYLQLQLDDASKQYVTVNTHRGLFRYNRLPFGVSAAPAIFQRCMENLLRGCQGVSVYLDDLLVTGSTTDEHLERLDHVLHILETAGLRLNRSKCAFLLPKVEYLGHIIDESGLHPTEEKVKAIQEAPAPKNLAELRSFLGIINYYSRFLPNLSH